MSMLDDFAPPPKSDAATQRRQVLAHLSRGGTLTPLEALQLYGIGRLAARVFDLKREGHMIVSKMVPVMKADGTEAHVAQYSMESAA